MYSTFTSTFADISLLHLYLAITHGFTRTRRSLSLSPPPPASTVIVDRKGKKRAQRSPTPPTSDPLTSSCEVPNPAKRPRRSSGPQLGRYELRSKGEEDPEILSARQGSKVRSTGRAPLKAKKEAKKMPKKAK